MKLEETLRGGYGGLYGEIVTEDIYKIKDLKFIPDVVFDLGSNISIFTRYIRSLFPKCLIVAVEPDEENYRIAKQFTEHNPHDNIMFLNKAIGIGQIYHGLTAANGSGETYLSIGKPYPKDKMDEAVDLEKIEVSTIMPDELLNTCTKEGDKVIVKIDVEGAEHIIWTHKPSMEALKKVDYLCMEIHPYAMNGELLEDALKVTEEALKRFEDTHTCVREGVHFYATKKNI